MPAVNKFEFGSTDYAKYPPCLSKHRNIGPDSDPGAFLDYEGSSSNSSSSRSA
jgi:hypothetical protein